MFYIKYPLRVWSKLKYKLKCNSMYTSIIEIELIRNENLPKKCEKII